MAFVIPYGVDNPMSRLPLVNWALIAANVAVFFLELSVGGPVFRFALFPADLRWYQPLTCAFLHAGWLHLIGNMIFLWTFGNNVNDKLGHLRFLAAYLVLAVTSSLGHLLGSLGSPFPMLGASGAISGVMGLYLAFFPLNDVRMLWLLWVRTGTFSCSSYWMIGLWVAWDLFHGLSGTAGNVAIWAHLAGFGVGFAAGLTMLVKGWVERDDYDFLSWLSRRQARKLGQRYGRPGAGPLPSPPAARKVAESPHEPPSPRELGKAIQAHLADGSLKAAQDSYQQFVQMYPRLALDKTTQLEVANALFWAGSYSLAADAYERFARFYPKHAQAPDALYSAGILYVHRLSRPDLGARLLEEALPLLVDSAKVERAREAIAATQGASKPKRVPLEE